MEQLTHMPVEVPEGARSFVANGKTYHKAESVSLARYKWYQRLSTEIGSGQMAHDLAMNDRKAFDLLNKTKFAEAAVVLHENIKGYADITAERYPAAMRLTLLFWNAEGEDASKMTEEMMAQKIADMEEAGIDARFFFVQALTSVHGLVSAYAERFPASSGAKDPSNEG